MQLPRSFARAAGWVILGTACVHPAAGASEACEAVVVSADPAVSTRWPDLHERVRRSLGARRDIDRCARVHLRPNRDGLTLEVILQDGRSATRWLPSSEDVLPGLEALLLVPSPSSSPSRSRVPPRSTLPPAAPVAKPPPAKQPTHREDPASVRDQGLAPEGARVDRRVGATLSLGGGARAGDGQVSSNLGAMALVIVSDWLAGFEARATSYEVPMSGHIPQSAVELTAVGGHRFGNGMFGVDLLLGPTLVVQQDVAVREERNGRVDHTHTSRFLPRVFAASRLTIGARSILSGFVGLEAAAGPSGTSDQDVTTALAPLPVWMLGFVVGATVGVP
ncbi:MAG TPA: hypothetical protein VI197_06025 [Polyangiaceae bacterium]